jgi:hypothetical protein
VLQALQTLQTLKFFLCLSHHVYMLRMRQEELQLSSTRP